MPVPNIIDVEPANLDTDVVLGTSVTIEFDTTINTASFNDASFLMAYQGTSSIATPDQLIASIPKSIAARGIVRGAFSSTGTDVATTLIFTPTHPLQPNTVYTVTLIGNDSIVPNGTVITTTDGSFLQATYRWTFTTGASNVLIPPSKSPLPLPIFPLDPSLITINPRITVIGNDLSQVIQIIFPTAIDQTSFSFNDLIYSVESMLGDPYIPIPPGLVVTAIIPDNSPNIIQITITGWS